MKIAINGKSLGISEKGGAVRVAVQLIKEMAWIAPHISFDVYIPAPCDFTEPRDQYPPNVNLRLFRSRLFGNGWARSLWEQIALPLIIRREKNHTLLLNLVNSAPVVIPPGIPQILLIHDVGFRDRNWFSLSFSIYLSLLVRAAAAQGVHLVTVSETSASQLTAMMPWVDRPSVILNASDEPWERVPAADLGYPYILFIGSLNPRKNIKGAIGGFTLYKSSTGSDLRLVIVGARKAFFAHESYDLTGAGDVVFMGYVGDEEKWSLLKGAKLLLMPSFLEGFGIPVLEALKAGVPVVASDIPVFRELYGHAVTYVDPLVHGEIACGIAHVIEDSTARELLIAEGKRVSRRFSWRIAAQEYIRLFERVRNPLVSL